MTGLSIVVNVSTILGLAAVALFFYFKFAERQQELAARRSISSVIEGDAHFNAEQILQILKLFKDESRRLNALKNLTNYGNDRAKLFLAKVESKVDVGKLVSQDKEKNRSSIIAGVFAFLFLAVGAGGHLLTTPPGPAIVPPAIVNPAPAPSPVPSAPSSGVDAVTVSRPSPSPPITHSSNVGSVEVIPRPRPRPVLAMPIKTVLSQDNLARFSVGTTCVNDEDNGVTPCPLWQYQIIRTREGSRLDVALLFETQGDPTPPPPRSRQCDPADGHRGGKLHVQCGEARMDGTFNRNNVVTASLSTVVSLTCESTNNVVQLVLSVTPRGCTTLSNMRISGDVTESFGR